MESHFDLESLFAEALCLGPVERVRMIEQLATEDVQAAASLRRLLHAHEQASVLDAPASLAHLEAGATEIDTVHEQVLDRAGQNVGEFRVLGTLGFGGMGAVYEAEQATPTRRVALKFLRSSSAESSLARRFLLEIETLARLDHPNIARIHGAGVHGEARQAWFAMELIDQPVPLVEFCERSRLVIEDRLRAFLSVVAAVHHAHRRGFLHRDLKSENLLVPATSADGRDVKVIDFGVARALTPLEGADLERTQGSELLGSFRTMSPELCAGRGDELDVRADVYSLGVVLYRLVVGQMPYELESASVPEILRRIRETPPADPAVFGVELDSDLVAILEHALAKEPDLRYDSVQALGDDLERYLERRPVLARRSSSVHRVRLFAKRRPALALSALLISLGAIAATVAIGVLYVRSERALVNYRLAEDRAVQQQSQVEAARQELEGVRRNLTESLVERSADRLAAARSGSERRRVVAESMDRLQALDAVLANEVAAYPALAEAYEDVGELYGNEWFSSAEDSEVGRNAYARAAELWEAMLDANPGNEEIRRELVLAQAAYVQACRRTGDEADGALVANQAVAHARDLVLSRGDDEALRVLVRALWARSDLHISFAPESRGLEDADEATAISLEVVARHPDDSEWQRTLAFGHFRMGYWWHYRPHLGSGLEQFALAVDAIERAAELAPSLRMAYETMTIVRSAATTSFQASRDSEGVEFTRRGMAILEAFEERPIGWLHPWSLLALELVVREDDGEVLSKLEDLWNAVDADRLLRIEGLLPLAVEFDQAGLLERRRLSSFFREAAARLAEDPEADPGDLAERIEAALVAEEESRDR